MESEGSCATLAQELTRLSEQCKQLAGDKGTMRKQLLDADSLQAATQQVRLLLQS